MISSHHRLNLAYVSGMLWKKDGRLFVPSTRRKDDQYRIICTYDGRLECECLGSYWYERCRHIEKAAYFLENFEPKTEEQKMFEKLTYNDPCREAIRQGQQPELLPRIRRDWNADM